MTSKEYLKYQALKKELEQCEDTDRSISLMHEIYVFETRHGLLRTKIPAITK